MKNVSAYLILSALVLLGCESTKDKCTAQVQPLKQDALNGAVSAAGQDADKMTALWSSVQKDAQAALDICKSAEQDREVLEPRGAGNACASRAGQHSA